MALVDVEKKIKPGTMVKVVVLQPCVLGPEKDGFAGDVVEVKAEDYFYLKATNKVRIFDPATDGKTAAKGGKPAA